MEKKTKVFMIVAVLILIIWLWLTMFKCFYKTEVEKLVDRYREIQAEYKVYEWKMNNLHNEAEWIRETLLNDYWLVFTQAWLETVK